MVDWCVLLVAPVEEVLVAAEGAAVLAPIMIREEGVAVLAPVMEEGVEIMIPEKRGDMAPPIAPAIVVAVDHWPATDEETDREAKETLSQACQQCPPNKA